MAADLTRGRVLQFVGRALVLVGVIAACQGGLSEASCGDRSTGYEECMDESTGSRDAGLVFVGLGVALDIVGAIDRRR